MADRPTCCIFIPTLTAGGAERVASQLANRWIGFARVVVVTYFDDDEFYTLSEDVEVYRMGFVSGRPTLARLIDILRAAVRFRRIVKDLAPSFLISFMNKYNAFAILSLVGVGVPVIVSERGSPTERLPFLRTLARDILYPLAAGLICQTRAGHDFIRSRTHVRRSIVIPNPVQRIIDPHDRYPQDYILGVGRFVESKAFDHLIRAFSAMRDCKLRLVLCGDGPLRGQLENVADELGVGDRVEFVGLVSDLAPYFRQARIFAFSSLHEGYPNALAEAAASGLPCVSYNCPTGPAEILRHGESGILVPVGDIGAFTAALERLASDRILAEEFGATAAIEAANLDAESVALRFFTFCSEAANSVRTA